MADPNEAAETQSQDQAQNNETDPNDVAAQAAKLLNADVRRNQARINALATGLADHHDELEQADSDYDSVRGEVDDDALRFAYAQLLNPVGLADQSRQVDTSGLGGFGASSGIVHAANVFGSPVQRAVAAMRTVTPPDPVTVIGAVPASDLADPDSLRKAQSGSGNAKKKSGNGNGGSSSTGSAQSGSTSP